MSAHHRLTSQPENVVWGYFDAVLPPVLEIDSGDLVTLDTVPATSWSEMPEDASRILPDHLRVMHECPRGPGFHPVTGPVAVRGAKTGDVLQIDILEILLRQDWGYTTVRPLLGTLPNEFHAVETAISDIDLANGIVRTPWGIEIPLDPFFGILAVAPPPAWGRQSSVIPRAFGGNMDNRELRQGSTLYLPVFNDGALFSAGDGHGVQGDGEVCLTALETALTGTFRLTVRKDLGYVWPFAEDAANLISIGIDEDLDDAARQAVREMIRELVRRKGLTPTQAYMTCSLAGSLRVTQTVDVHKGAHMLLAKSLLGG
jgi:acetamidase/formamidase